MELGSRSRFLGYITTKILSKILDLSVLLTVCRPYIYMYMFGWLCRGTCCSVVASSMLGVSHAVQYEKKLWKFTHSDRWGNGARSTGGDV